MIFPPIRGREKDGEANSVRSWISAANELAERETRIYQITNPRLNELFSRFVFWGPGSNIFNFLAFCQVRCFEEKSVFTIWFDLKPFLAGIWQLIEWNESSKISKLIFTNRDLLFFRFTTVMKMSWHSRDSSFEFPFSHKKMPLWESIRRMRKC